MLNFYISIFRGGALLLGEARPWLATATFGEPLALFDFLLVVNIIIGCKYYYFSLFQ